MKIESKKLRLSQKKCAQIHVGKNNLDCDTFLKVHEDEMKKAQEGAYLGDILSYDGKPDKTIENRRQKGIGICSQITGLMNSVSLGFFFFNISFTLRNSMLVNGILTNAEVWNDVKMKQIETLESVDLLLLRKIFNAHSMTAKETFFLEAGLMPIRFIISKRRLLYLWNILQRDDSELLKRFYFAQKVVKTKNDWAEMIENEKKEFEIDYSDEEISRMKESKYKSIVTAAIASKAIEHLNKIADSHSKSKILVKGKLEREKYLEDKRFTRSEAELLFSLRTRMVDLKRNFSNKYGDDIACRTCHVQVECQEHILKCERLRERIDVPKDVTYEDLFKDVDKQLEITKLFKKLLREREILMNSRQ